MKVIFSFLELERVHLLGGGRSMEPSTCNLQVAGPAGILGPKKLTSPILLCDIYYYSVIITKLNHSLRYICQRPLSL